MENGNDPYADLFLWFSENEDAFPEINEEQMRTKTRGLNRIMTKYHEELESRSWDSAMTVALRWGFKMEYLKLCRDPRCAKVFAQDEVFGRKLYCNDQCGHRYRERLCYYAGKTTRQKRQRAKKANHHAP